MKISLAISHLILGALLPCLLPAQVKPALAGTYSWTYSDREGRPSKCDCDYHLEQVTLNADSTCLYLSQRGRMDPIYQQWEKGTWELVSGDEVVLHITEIKGGLPKLGEEKYNPKKWRPQSSGHSFTLVGRHLEDGGRIYD